MSSGFLFAEGEIMSTRMTVSEYCEVEKIEDWEEYLSINSSELIVIGGVVFEMYADTFDIDYSRLTKVGDNYKFMVGYDSCSEHWTDALREHLDD